MNCTMRRKNTDVDDIFTKRGKGASEWWEVVSSANSPRENQSRIPHQRWEVCGPGRFLWNQDRHIRWTRTCFLIWAPRSAQGNWFSCHFSASRLTRTNFWTCFSFSAFSSPRNNWLNFLLFSASCFARGNWCTSFFFSVCWLVDLSPSPSLVALTECFGQNIGSLSV